MFNQLKYFGAAVQRVLPPGERLLELGLYHQLAGDDSRLTRPMPEPGERDRLIEGFDPTIGGLQVNPDRIDRLLGGLSGEGDPDSVAGRWWRAANGEKWDTTEYAVTDRRLLLLTSRSRGAGESEYKILYALPRAQVASARRRPKWLFQWGRVEVRFTDGSMIAWAAGLLSTARARALVAALSGPGYPGTPAQ